jgi:hypothetical protein
MCAHFEVGDVSSVCAGISGRAPSPRVPVAISNVAASKIAAVSAAVTSATGVFIVTRSRLGSSRVVAKFANGLSKQSSGKLFFGYAGIGIAMLTLIESTVRVTIRQSDSEPIANEAATASISRDEATGAERQLKPAAPGDRIMA